TQRIQKYRNSSLSIQKNNGSVHQKDSLIDILVLQLESMPESDSERFELEKLLEVSKRPNNLDSLFNDYTMVDATEFIVKASKNYHFTSINESHFSGLNRNYVRSLLLPLWESGYRYFAMEALSQRDSLINSRSIPLMSSGYYFNEVNLGNLVREAKKIGYKLIAYDEFFNTENNDQNQSLREKAQAQNLYDQTLANDSIGKVLIYSGHDHQVTENMNGNRFMGGWLREISGLDLLTIEQVIMTEKTSIDKENDYYRYVKLNYSFDNGVVFTNLSTEEVLIDPIHHLSGIKVQVYHPPTKYIYNRPNWMLNNQNAVRLLPDSIIKKYKGKLIEFRPYNEPNNSTPIDKFIIDTDKGAVIPKGEFSVRIINCDNEVIANYKVSL
ncbi:MAG: hypothetical protein WD512_07200, partial [Candidatus Paceibacterota bacterium]